MTAVAESYVVDTLHDDLRALVISHLDTAWSIGSEVSLHIRPGAVDLGRYVMQWYVMRKRDGVVMHADTEFVIGNMPIRKVLTIRRDGEEFCRVAYLRRMTPANEEEP